MSHQWWLKWSIPSPTSHSYRQHISSPTSILPEMRHDQLRDQEPHQCDWYRFDQVYSHESRLHIHQHLLDIFRRDGYMVHLFVAYIFDFVLQKPRHHSQYQKNISFPFNRLNQSSKDVETGWTVPQPDVPDNSCLKLIDLIIPERLHLYKLHIYCIHHLFPTYHHLYQLAKSYILRHYIFFRIIHI